MNRRAAIEALIDIASGIGSSCTGSEWYLFGSIARGDLAPNDIDLIILCVDHAQADILRAAINTDALDLPLDLSLLTFEEAAEIDAIDQQKAQKFFPDCIVDGKDAERP
ncbi:MAG: nucleotidyltransferase domain-containing protein [Pseudomonadales bacterium]